jgi:hypothetical protein
MQTAMICVNRKSEVLIESFSLQIDDDDDGEKKN